MNEFKIFTDLMGSLIAKYADKIDLDKLPDVPNFYKKAETKENVNSLMIPLAS